MKGHKKNTSLVLLIILLLCPLNLSADIYTYVDNDGVIHFTNVPTSSDNDYKLYIRERPRRTRDFKSTSKYDPIIERASAKFGVDSSLVKAVIKVESGFDPNAVSRKGARGLMQIMPENYDSLYISDPFDPQDNIMGGTFYLKKLINRYENNIPLALAAYNAGPDAVDRFNTIPPYRETEGYVKKVMTAYNIYKRLET